MCFWATRSCLHPSGEGGGGGPHFRVVCEGSVWRGVWGGGSGRPWDPLA